MVEEMSQEDGVEKKGDPEYPTSATTSAPPIPMQIILRQFGPAISVEDVDAEPELMQKYWN